MKNIIMCEKLKHDYFITYPNQSVNLNLALAMGTVKNGGLVLSDLPIFQKWNENLNFNEKIHNF